MIFSESASLANGLELLQAVVEGKNRFKHRYALMIRAKQLALGEPLDPGWIYDTDRVIAIVQIQDQLIAISSGSKADMKEIRSLLLEPRRQELKVL